MLTHLSLRNRPPAVLPTLRLTSPCPMCSLERRGTVDRPLHPGPLHLRLILPMPHPVCGAPNLAAQARNPGAVPSSAAHHRLSSPPGAAPTHWRLCSHLTAPPTPHFHPPNCTCDPHAPAALVLLCPTEIKPGPWPCPREGLLPSLGRLGGWLCLGPTPISSLHHTNDCTALTVQTHALMVPGAVPTAPRAVPHPTASHVCPPSAPLPPWELRGRPRGQPSSSQPPAPNGGSFQQAVLGTMSVCSLLEPRIQRAFSQFL